MKEGIEKGKKMQCLEIIISVFILPENATASYYKWLNKYDEFIIF